MALVLGADIGGTNANFGIVDTKHWQILFQERYDTKKVRSFPKLVETFLTAAVAKLGKAPEAAGFAIAGPVVGLPGKQSAKLTNAKLRISEQAIKRGTKLKRIVLINDFVALGYATNIIKARELKTLRRGAPIPGATRAIIGPGTGLGNAILVHDGQRYYPIPSEGGHCDLPVACDAERDLLLHIRETRSGGKNQPIEYETLVSGPGLERIYAYLREMECPHVPERDAHGIAGTIENDACSKKAFDLFLKFFARAAKNFVLDTYALGGLYLAGGITARHANDFNRSFLAEFDRHARPEFRKLLKRVPIRIITNYDISIKGAAFCAAKD